MNAASSTLPRPPSSRDDLPKHGRGTRALPPAGLSASLPVPAAARWAVVLTAHRRLTRTSFAGQTERALYALLFGSLLLMAVSFAALLF